MMTKNKISILLFGFVLPFVIFVASALFVKMIATAIFVNKEINAMILQGIANALTLIILIPLYKSFSKVLLKTFEKANSLYDKFDFSHVLYLIPLAFSVCIICNVLINLLPISTDNIASREVMDINENYGVIISIIIVGLIVPVVEELIFRGFVFDVIKVLTNVIIATIISSMLFALAHGNIAQGIYAFVAGLILSFIRYYYKSVIYSIIMHIFMNITTLVFVDSILNIKDNKQIAFVIFIAITILALTLIRIFYKKKVEEK